MRINIAASHRFHLLDLARELEKLGHDVQFYSYVPSFRTKKYGLKRKNSYSLAVALFPLLIINKMWNNEYTTRLVHFVLDRIVSIIMKPCDVFISIGSVYEKAIFKAKNKYKAVTILEWGSKHIIEQRLQFGDLNNYPIKFLNKELKSYELNDYISIPAEHVKESFIKHGICDSKLIINPYGVDLNMFYPPQVYDKTYDLIFVGGWRYEKGIEMIIQFSKENPNLSFLHVGSIVNAEFPDLKNMKHINSVNQTELVKYYSKAKVFVIPSRSEGLALVQAQAIACGLPVVCSKHTGGRDLKKILNDSECIIEMKDYTYEDFSTCIIKALEIENLNKKKSNDYNQLITRLSWKSYSQRYENSLKFIMSCL